MRKRSWFLPLLSAIFLVLGLPPFRLYFLAWVAFIPLFYLMFDARLKLGTIIISSLSVGLLYYGWALLGLIHYQAIVYIGALLAALPALPAYFLCVTLLRKKVPESVLCVLVVPLTWYGVHELYGMTPFGSAAMEAPFYGSLAVMQIASVSGFAVFTAFMMSLNALLAAMICKPSRWNIFLLAVGTAVFLMNYFWGHSRLNEKFAGEKQIKAALIQHNLPVSGLWNLDHPQEITGSYRRLALEAARERPDLIVFPLYNLPEDPLRNPGFFSELARETQTYLLLASHVPHVPAGSILKDGYFNVALLFSPEGKLAGTYQAVQGAPTFSPVKEWTAKEHQNLESPLGKLGILLCYEDTGPEIAKAAVRKGADILIAISNPGHFSKTHFPEYHLIQDQLRAIESKRPLLRASSNGYSAVLDVRGRILQKSSLEQEEILYGTIEVE